MKAKSKNVLARTPPDGSPAGGPFKTVGTPGDSIRLASKDGRAAVQAKTVADGKGGWKLRDPKLGAFLTA